MKNRQEITSQDYVMILRAELAKRQKQNPKYSIRRFGEDLGVDSGTMTRYVNGDRILSYPAAKKIIPKLRLNPKDLTVFLSSVEVAMKERGLAVAKEEKEVAQNGKPVLKKEEPKLSPTEKARLDKIKHATSLIDRVDESRTFNNSILFVTTAMEGAEADRHFLSSIETFLNFNNAEFIISTSGAHLKALSDDVYPLDDILLDNYYDCVHRAIRVNDHLHIRNLDIKPYVPDPISGLAELGAENGRSYIIPHPQQRMKTYPNGMSALPRIQWCTGMLTKPLYRDNKSGYLADKRHVMGGLVIEVRDDKFWIRDVQMDVDGSFIDKGLRYNPNGTIEAVRAQYLVRGDDHVGFQDQTCVKVLDEVTDTFLPLGIYVHDLMDSASISHHRERSMSAMLSVPESIDTLEKELGESRKFLKYLNDRKPQDCKIYVVPANHNEHLHRYLDERRFVMDKTNFKKAVELAHFYFNHGIDPIIYGIDPREELAVWLRRNDPTLRVCGVALSHHGDRGPNGSKGTVKGDCISYGRSSAGHSHSPEIWRGSRRVGTTSLLSMDYTVGSPSSWAHCFEIGYESKVGGPALRQTMFSINGEWCLDPAGTKLQWKLFANGAGIKDVKKAKEKLRKKAA